MKVSIAMATYNGAQYLQEQLNSFKNQTQLPDELIVTDDCSTDETEQIISEFAKTAPFTVIFSRNEKNLGYCGNFNAALMQTSGDLVFLSDQDDVWFPEKIEYMVALAEKNPKSLVLMNDAAITDGVLNKTGLTNIGQVQTAGFNLSYFAHGCCCTIRRELLDICLPITIGYKAHDIWLLAFAKGLEARLIDPNVLQYYRRHGKNESQIIVNSTTKITYLDSLSQALKNSLNKNSHEAFAASGEQMQLLNEGVRRAIKKAPTDWKIQLESLSLKIEKDIAIHKNRILIREKYLPVRMVLASNAFVKGFYKNSNGFKSMLRDVFG